MGVLILVSWGLSIWAAWSIAHAKGRNTRPFVWAAILLSWLGVIWAVMARSQEQINEQHDAIRHMHRPAP